MLDLDALQEALRHISGYTTNRVLKKNATDGRTEWQALVVADIPTGIDHGGLAGLADDDHTQYALLAGRSGGQTWIGGTATGNKLILQANSANGSDAEVEVLSTATGGTGAQVALYQDSASPAAGDIAGTINIYAKDANGTKTLIGVIKSGVNVATAAAMSSRLSFQTLLGGANRSLDFDPSNSAFYPGTDAFWDLGISATNRFRNAYLSASLDAATSVRSAGYIAAGFSAASLPTNVTAGDVTGLRAHIGTDAAFTSGMGFETNAIQSKFGGSKTLTTSLDAVVVVNPTLTNNTNNFISGLNVSPTLNGSGDSAAGLVVRPLIAPSGNITDAYGASLAAIGNIPSGVTLTNLIGFRGALATLSGTGAITNAIAIKAEGAFVVAGGPTPTNNIGLNVTAASGGTNNYDLSFGTVDTTAAGAYYGRLPVLYNGLKKYIHVFSA